MKAKFVPVAFVSSFLYGWLSAVAAVGTAAETIASKADSNAYPVPRVVSGTYSREERLRRVEVERARIEGNPALAANEKSQLIEGIMAQADGNHLTHLKWAEGGRYKEQVYPFAKEMEAKWQDASAFGYVQALSIVAVDLLDRFSVSTEETAMARRLVEGSMERLADVPTRTAVGALLRFSMGWARGSEPVVPMDWIPREAALAAYLRVVGDVNEFLKLPATNAFAGLLETEARYLATGNEPYTFGGRRTTDSDREEYRKRIQFLADRQYYEDKLGTDPVHDTRYGNAQRLQGALTNHLQRHFTLASADLDTVQFALDKYVKDPALKERIVLAAYKGTNPFIGRVPGAKDATVAIKASTPTSKPAFQGGTPTQVAKKATAPPVAEPRPAASNSVPLATTSGVSVGYSMLWLAFAVAAAVIVFVLRRAQARGNPGRSK